jgi:hypothetical protein
VVALPKADPLTGKLQTIVTRLEDIKKKIVATTEGGAITGEERIREHLDLLYGALQTWEGKPAKYQLDRLDVLKRELDEVAKDFESVVSKDVRALDAELKAHKLEPISAVERAHEDLDASARRCVESRGRDCKPDAAAIATERD